MPGSVSAVSLGENLVGACCIGGTTKCEQQALKALKGASRGQQQALRALKGDSRGRQGSVYF